MNKKQSLSLVILMLLGIWQASAQVNMDFSKRLENAVSGQDITNKAIKGSVVVVRQSYQVKNKKSGKVFGRNGKKMFGQDYSIGVKTEAGLVLTDAALKPWEDDSAFKKVEKEYDPVISLTEIRDIESDGQVNFTQSPLNFDSNQPQGLWVAQFGTPDTNAMEIDVEEGSKGGWLIWYTADKPLTGTADDSFSIQAVGKKITFTADVTEVDIEPPVSAHTILGAIYISPSYPGGGHVTYRLVGMAVKNGSQWKLRTPFVSFTFEKSSLSQPIGQHNQQTEEQQIGGIQQEDVDVELTPIAQDKKKKK